MNIRTNSIKSHFFSLSNLLSPSTVCREKNLEMVVMAVNQTNTQFRTKRENVIPHEFIFSHDIVHILNATPLLFIQSFRSLVNPGLLKPVRYQTVNTIRSDIKSWKFVVLSLLILIRSETRMFLTIAIS